MQHLVDFAGRKSAHNLILRDMLMLENQVPLFLLHRILEPQCAYPGEAGELLPRMVTGLMKELCPFKMVDMFLAIEVSKNAARGALLSACAQAMTARRRPSPTAVAAKTATTTRSSRWTALAMKSKNMPPAASM